MPDIEQAALEHPRTLAANGHEVTVLRDWPSFPYLREAWYYMPMDGLPDIAKFEADGELLVAVESAHPETQPDEDGNCWRRGWVFRPQDPYFPPPYESVLPENIRAGTKTPLYIDALRAMTRGSSARHSRV
jgi:hypothetical protein